CAARWGSTASATTWRAPLRASSPLSIRARWSSASTREGSARPSTMYVPRNPGLAPRALFIPPAGKGATLDCSGLLLFSKALMGIRYALTALGIGPGEAVLAPAYLTGSALAPFDWAGVRCALYDVERTTLAPDWGSVARAQARAK